ncbi:MAG: dihydropteroate synthase [Planctomycetes bacterium]|nr:dihydropteroate synthase [Planctomycetota bacterium]
MGILNITPDSFSDGGLYDSAEKAVSHGLEMLHAGAAIIDIGAESTRPGAQPIAAEEQIRRVVPAVEALRKQSDIPISIDTFNPTVAAAAVAGGANIINDITALSDAKMAKLAAEKQLPVILMHIQGTPATMQQNPHYKNVVAEVKDYLLRRAAFAEQAGIPKERIFIDPGFGFGKTTEHNLSLLRHLDEFVNTGYRVLAGTSRKRFIGQITAKDVPADRIFGTAATVAMAVAKGASIVRVHDVAQMTDVVKIASAVIGDK